MPGPKPAGKEALGDLLAYLHKQGIAEIHMKGFTQEEEEKEMRNTFKEIAGLEYPHIHTFRVIPSNGREPYKLCR
jgi:hypothetical protein